MTELVNEVHYVKGFELIKQGQYEEDNGRKIDPLTQYTQQMPVIMQINHKRRLINAYKDKGQNGVIEYIRNIKKLAYDQAQAEINSRRN